MKKYSLAEPGRRAVQDRHAEVRRSKVEQKRVTEERDILKKGRHVRCQDVRGRYAFVRQQQAHHSVRRLCQVLAIDPRGYYVWRSSAGCRHSIGDKRLLAHIRPSWLEGGAVQFDAAEPNHVWVTDITYIRTHEG